MVIDVLTYSVLAIGIAMPMFSSSKGEAKIRIPKNHNDTSRAQYAINDHGYLERIHNDNLSSHKQ